ncbi:long-chain-fatty-acid--CoA ligase [Oceanobacillus kimchii]|uniref:long-chain-fatty-acid--CoA ligase n=1 Tax=Oceanobacillus kimchii TaxID=746691 RepID=UPI0003455CDF|nr:long-chain fatty acid--CoA ligase [Oceanobacillus kimchii]
MDRPWVKHIPEGNPTNVQIPEISLQELLLKSVETYSDKVAMTFFDQTYTYQQLEKMIYTVASSLYNLGIEKGDRIALMLPNCPQYPISYFATLLCGGIIVQINPMYKSNELLHVLNDSGAKVIICLDSLLPIVDEVKDQTDLLSIIPVSFENDSKFNELLIDKGYKLPEISIDPIDDIAVLQYTGGTTGRSKGVMLTHYNLVANTIQSYGTSQINIKTGEEKVLTISPLFHVYGMTSCMNFTFFIGGNLILVPRFEVEQTVEIIEKVKPSLFMGVPTMFIALLNYYHEEKQFDLSCLRTCSSGSAPLPVEIINQFNNVSGSNVAEGFGLSEASPVTHRNPVEGLQKPGSIGIPIPNTDSKIVDLATGEETLSNGEVGELVIKGPQVMKGYWRMEDETNQVLRNGWLYTGDLAKMDDDGFFYITGRKKELIIASGYNIYPVEIEDVIYQHPSVLEVAIIGVPDKYRGETVKAFVVLKSNATLTEDDLIQYCRDRLASFKVPRSVEFLQELPKTAVGKILKRKLKEQFS